MAEGEKRLQILLSLMSAKGVTKIELAGMMGMSRQNIHTFFRRDDMKLSLAQEIAGKLGYDLSYRLEKEGDTSNVVTEIEGLVGKDGLQRLAFLRIAMSRYGIERRQLAEDLGFNYAGIGRWFRVDDIAISHIYRIAELYGLNVKIKATIKRETTNLVEITLS